MIATTRPEISVSEPTLYVAFELGKKDWKLAMTSGMGVDPWLRTVGSGDLAAVQRAVQAGRERFALAAAVPVVSCYEAGRDGFWIHRALTRLGVRNRVVDSASIEVNRRARRAKTDRLDAVKLARMLVRVCAGERGVWSEVRVPSVAVEAARQVSRERTALTQEQTRLGNQLRSWLAVWGCALPRRRPSDWWATVRDWAGAALPAEVQARLARAAARLAILEAQIAALEAQQQAAVQAATPASALRQLVRIKGVATTSASVLLDEGLVWRAFRNRRQIGGLLGFAPTPYDSGESHRDQGIRGAGNARLQSISIQLAWNWVRWQPDSALTRWYRQRFGEGKRVRRIGIVALARKLLIALWRYATSGVVPTGAVLKSDAVR
ncbi:MAG TPA: IS110 family transposase [Candidatus Dormibacteraeota bacterium]|nr:IS110 family transposase [Candidatus Dormibacteraeota bacterium]